MGPLPEDTPFDRVIPLLTEFFGQQDDVEDAVMAAFSENLDDTPFLVLIEEALEWGHLSPEDIYSEFQAFLGDELSEASWLELRELDYTFLQAAALGDAASLWILGLRLVHAANCSLYLEAREDLDRDGLFLIVEAAEAGDSRAQWMVGERFSRMRHGLDESIRLLGMAAAQGFELAAARLEELFDNRFAFVHAASERKWLRRFARAGVVAAQFELANELYLGGDLKSAFAWMLQAANASHLQAQQRLAFFYEVGQGCSRNRQRAEYWRNISRPEENSPPPSPGENRKDGAAPTSVIEPTENQSTIPMMGVVEPQFNEVQEAAGGELESSAHDPVLTPEETLLAEETLQELTPEEVPVDVPFPEAEQESTEADRAQPSVVVTVQPGGRSGLISHFRSGLAEVLRRLADKIGNSTSTNDDDQ